MEGIASDDSQSRRVAGDGFGARPGRLTVALGIDKRFDGIDLCDRKSPIWLGAGLKPAPRIGVSVRIGISRAAHRKLRFYERGSAFVSGPLRLRS